LAPRSVTAAIVLALCAALLLAAAAPASAISRKQAAKKAIAALGSSYGSDAVVVFGLTKPLRAGSRISHVGAKRGSSLVGKLGERAFFFYEQSGPFQLDRRHPGRVALVGAKSGTVKLSKTITWQPLVNGRLPAFLKNSKSYRSSKYRVFYRAAGTPAVSTGDAGASLFANDPFEPRMFIAANNSPPQANAQDVTVKQNTPKNIVLTGSDGDGDPITFRITRQPYNGTLSGQPPEVTYTPNAGYLGTDSFRFRTNDGEAPGDSNSAKVSINVVPRGVASTVTASPGCTAYTEQAPAVVVDGLITVVDPDDVTLDSARVRIAANFQGGDDLLFTDQNGISGSYSDNTGTLTLTGTTSVANYQAALRSVRYRNLASGNASATKDVEFTVNDAGGDSAPATKQICITGGSGGGNNPPVGETSEGALSYIENDGPVPLDAGFVVGDPDSANLSGATVKFVPVVSQPVDENGDPVGPPTSTVTFAPAEDELAFADQNGITGSYDDETGVLTLSGSASVANYETAIRSVTYENTSEDPSDAIRRLQFQVTDSSGANSPPRRRDIFVTPVNDAPVVTTSEGSTSGAGSDPAVTIDADLTTLDVDDDDLEGAQVRISTGFVSGDDLVFVDQLGISGVYDTGTGILTLTGTASVADYQTALRSVQYSHPEGNPAGSRTVEFTVNDGDLDSGSATKNLELNDKPILDTTDTALSYTENAGPVAVDSGIAATDPDTADLTGATVQITGNFSSDEDDLAFTDQNGISGSYDDSSGTLTLSGTASVADYQTALAGVTYENSSENPSTATRTVTFQADDGGTSNNLSDPATRDIEVTSVNDAPVVTTSEGSVSYTEDDGSVAIDSGIAASDVDSTELVGATVQITANFSTDEDGLAFTDQNGISGAYDDSTGTLTLSGTASVADYQTALAGVSYENSSDNPSTATRTVSFQVDDGAAGDNLSDLATRDIAVTATNDAPTVTTSDGSTSYTVGDPAQQVDPAVSVADVDDTDLESAEVRVSSGFEAGDDLVFVDQSGISGVYNTGTGVLTLTGTASVADYETALRSIEYSHTGDNPAASKTVEFKVNDGDADSDPASKSIDVSPPPNGNAPVVTTSDGVTSYPVGDTEGQQVDPALTVTDADDTNLESAVVRVLGFEPGDDLVFVDQSGISGVYDTGTGVLTLTGTASVADYETALRSIKYRHTGESPPPSTTVEFTVNDGDVDSDPASKTIIIGTPEL
jgi:hypothetical protein